MRHIFLASAASLAFAATAPLDEIADTVSAARRNQSMVNDDATFARFTESHLR